MNKIIMNDLPELPFDVEESINQLRVNLSFAGVDTKVVFVTSTVPNEGKSFICMQLWRSLAGIDRHVLLIDADMRMSEMRNDYGFSMQTGYAGIAHYLSGQAEVNDVVYATNVPNGYIVPVTNLIANPAPLLESERFQKLIEACRKTFDYVIIDTPPLGSVADALNISRYCDGGILVVRSDGVSRKLVQNSVASLKRAGSPLLGIVLNRVNMRQHGNYYYKSYYKYGYGADYYRSDGKSKKHRKKKK